MDVQAVIDKAGGAARLAEMLGIHRVSVLDWRRTGAIPGARVRQISEATGISVDEIISLVQEPKSRATHDAHARPPQAGEDAA